MQQNQPACFGAGEDAWLCRISCFQGALEMSGLLYGLEFRACGLGFRTLGLGFRVLGSSDFWIFGVLELPCGAFVVSSYHLVTRTVIYAEGWC